MSIFDRIVEYSNISKPSERVPKEDGGMLVQPSDDGSRLGYKGKKSDRYIYSDNYRTIYDKETKLYSKKVGRDRKLLTQEPGETKKEFFKRVANYSTETATARTDKFTKEILDSRNKIDSWTSNWLSKNLKNYGVRDFDKMVENLKRDWKIESKKLKLPTDKIKIFTESGFPNLSTSKGKETAVSKNPFTFDDITFYTPENPSGKEKYMAQWKKIFFKNKIENTPGLKNKLSNYFEFMNLDKRGSPASGGPTIKSYKDIMDKDVVYILSEEDSGLKKGAKYDVFNSFDDLADSYNKFTLKMNRSESWKENAGIIEEALGLKKNSIKNSMQAEQRALKKILDVSSLEGTGFGYSIDHGQGLAAAAKSGDVNLMKIALNDLIGTTQDQNTKAGFGGFEKVRGALIRDIQAGVNVKDNVKSLNKLTNDVYKDLGVNKNIYSIKDNKLVSKPLSPQTTREERFTSYFKDIYKTGEGKELIQKQYGDLNKLIASLSNNPACAVFAGKRGKFDVGGSPNANIDDCVQGGIEVINSGKIPANKATEFANFTKRASTLGKNIMKFGIIPEAIFVGADSLVRMGLGDTFKEAGLRASDYLLPGDQTKEAEMLKVKRTLGDKSAEIVGRAIDYRNQLSKIDSLKQEKQFAETLSPTSEFDYLPDRTEDIKNIDTRIKQAESDLTNKFMIPEKEKVYAERAEQEAYDISKAKSPFVKALSYLRAVQPVENDPLAERAPEKQMDLSLFPTLPTQFMELSNTDLIPYTNVLREMGYEVTPKEVIAERDILKKMPLEQMAQEYSPEQIYGAQGTFFGQPLAGGGLANLTKTIPPESGPQSEGLLSLKNRVINS